MDNKRKILILGAKGMLGQELVRCYGEDEGYAVIGWDIEDIDVTDFPEAEKKIRAVSPDVMLNAIAYNAVDQCEENEEEYQKAFLLNAEVPAFLARLAQDMGAAFIQYSTDYVFDGESEDGYAEDALPRPLSKYGMSKWEGEKAILSVFDDSKNEIPRQARNDMIIIALVPDKEILYERIVKRLEKRIAKGMIEEVEHLHTEGVGWERLEAFGLEYRYIALFLQEKITEAAMREELLHAIWHYAKRQLSWLRRWERLGANIRWISDPKEAEEVF